MSIFWSRLTNPVTCSYMRELNRRNRRNVPTTFYQTVDDLFWHAIEYPFASHHGGQQPCSQSRSRHNDWATEAPRGLGGVHIHALVSFEIDLSQKGRAPIYGHQPLCWMDYPAKIKLSNLMWMWVWMWMWMWMWTEVDLNECEHFLKANWDRSKRVWKTVNTFSK